MPDNATDNQTYTYPYMVWTFMNERDLGWLEGIIDGEGCLMLGRCHRVRGKTGKKYISWLPILTITNTDMRIIERAKEIIGCGSIVAHPMSSPNWKQAYRLTINSNGLRRLLPMLELVGKQGQRNLLLEALRSIGKGRNHTDHPKVQRIYIEIRKLNKKGPIDGQSSRHTDY